MSEDPKPSVTNRAHVADGSSVAHNRRHAAARSRKRRTGRALTLLVAFVLQLLTGAIAFVSGLVIHPIVWWLLLAGWLVALILIFLRRTQPIVVLAISLAYAAGLLLTIFLADQAGLTGV
jgi:hypothetical protein